MLENTNYLNIIESFIDDYAAILALILSIVNGCWAVYKEIQNRKKDCSKIIISKIKEDNLYAKYYIKNIGGRIAKNIDFHIESNKDIYIDRNQSSNFPIESMYPNNEPYILTIYIGEVGEATLYWKWNDRWCTKKSEPYNLKF